MSEYTVRNRWIVLRSLYGWAAGEEVIPNQPARQDQRRQGRRAPPDVLDDDAIAALLAACRGTAFADRRDLALIRLLLATGLRASERRRLKLGDVDLRTRIVSVHEGKGGRSRLTRFDRATAAAVDRYNRLRGRHRYALRPELWIGHRGPLSREGLGPILDKRAGIAGLGHVHPHQLRHTFAHRMKKAGASLEDLGQLGGWSSPSPQALRRLAGCRALARGVRPPRPDGRPREVDAELQTCPAGGQRGAKPVLVGLGSAPATIPFPPLVPTKGR